MDKTKVEADYLKYLKSNYNPERAVKEKAYLYSAYKHYGLSAAQMSKYFNKLKPEIKHLDKRTALDLVKHFWTRPSHEEKMLALHIMNVHKEKLDINDMPSIEKMMRESGGWVYLDNLIIPLMPEILKKDKKGYEYLKKWIKDNDFWVRRSALLAQLLFFRKGLGGDNVQGIKDGPENIGSRKLFFEMARSQFDESWINVVYKEKLQRERARFFIRKAIGWVLREMSIKEPDVVRKFLEENKGKMSGLSYREGGKRLGNKKI
jgi:3-methyladenine DNA glycosylase AlkD